MSEAEESPASPEPGKQLARADQQPGSLLRLRDVQALNRSFRRLAEVQEALLEQFAELQAERRGPRRWLLPALAGGGLVLGAGLGILGLSWWESGRPAAAIEVQSASPEVIVQPPRVAVEVPADTVSQETLQAFLSELNEERRAREEDRALIETLRERLFAQQEATTNALRSLGSLAGGIGRQTGALNAAARDSAVRPEPPPEAVAEPAAARLAPSDPWLGALNGLLALDGHGGLQFQSGERVPGQPVLHDVSALEWDGNGQLQGVLEAQRAEFELHEMSGSLIATFFDGHRNRNGVRRSFGPEGSRLQFDGVDARKWADLWPELAPPPPAAVEPPPAGRALEVQAALDGFLAVPRAYGYYRLAALERVEDGRLRLAQINWFDSAGRLIKTLECDSLEIKLHPPDSVELLLRDGAVLEGGLRKPFYEDRYRLFLPRQDLEAWRASPVPLTARDAP